VVYDRLAHTSWLMAVFAVVELLVCVQILCIIKDPSTKTTTFLFRRLRRGGCITHTVSIFDKLIIKYDTTLSRIPRIYGKNKMICYVYYDIWSVIFFLILLSRGVLITILQPSVRHRRVSEDKKHVEINFPA
jgi:hypothetical protein